MKEQVQDKKSKDFVWLLTTYQPHIYASMSAFRRGDLNSDGQVNLNDFSLLASTWHKSSAASSSSSSQSGDTDFQTLLALAENWLQ